MENQPNTYINNPIPQPTTQQSNKWWQNKKVWAFLVGAIILGEVVWSVYTLSKPLPQNGQKVVSKATTPVASEVPKASLSLVGPATVKASEEFKTDVKVDTQGGLADGIDLVIKYDPNYLEVINPTSPMVVSQLYPTYPANSTDTQIGLITVSGVTSQDSPSFSGQGVLGSISFRAKQLGQTSITLDFTKGLTTDSNIVETTSGNDILDKVDNLSLTIN